MRKKIHIFLFLLTAPFFVAAQENATQQNPVVKVANLPFGNTLDIQLVSVENTPIEVSVYNLLGEEVFQELYDGRGVLQLTIPTDKLERGVYFLTIRQNGSIQTRKLTKS